MSGQSKLMQRLQRLREEKEVLRSVIAEPRDVTPISAEGTRHTDRQSAQKSDLHGSEKNQVQEAPNIAKSKAAVKPKSTRFPRQPPKKLAHVSGPSVNVPPPTPNILHIDARTEADPASMTHTGNMASPQLAELMGKVGFQSSRESLSTLEVPSAAHNDDDSLMAQSNTEGAPLKYQFTLSEDFAAISRPVSAIRFHSKFDNVLLTAHGARADNKLGAPLGTVALWAADQPQKSLQRTLISPASVTALELFSMSPTLVLGGTSIGSIHLWDLRVKTALPVTAFDEHAMDISDCHGRHAVTSIRTTAVSSPFFITTSANGHVCKWTLSQTDGPLSQSVVHDPVISDKIPIRTMDFPRSTRLSTDDRKATNRSPSLFVGTTQGNICRLEADGRSWSVSSERGTHDAPITAVRAHPGGSRVPYLDDVLATSSYDWNLNVWYFRRGQACKKLWSYDNIVNGSIFDITWSSMHPTVLCSGSEAGVLSMFDLSGHLQNAKTGSALWKFVPPVKKLSPLTTLQWSNNDRLICAGDMMGNTHVWSTTSFMATLPNAEWMAQYLKSLASRV